jgi:hypothetical protein
MENFKFSVGNFPFPRFPASFPPETSPLTPAPPLRLDSLDALRAYVEQTLCDREQLVPGAFPFTERVLTRGGRPCGRYFCVHGPRSVKVTAIWETDRNRLLFYDCAGERFQKTLVEATGCKLRAKAESRESRVESQTALSGAA